MLVQFNFVTLPKVCVAAVRLTKALLFLLTNISKFIWEVTMPVHKTKGGYKYGKSGKTYPTKAQAEKQGRAIKASQARSEKKK